MIDTMTQGLAAIVILLTFVIIVLVTQALRRRRDLVAVRPIAAYDALPMLANRAIEASRPLHLSLGAAGIGGESTLLAITSAELAYQLASRAVIGDAAPIMTLSNASALPLGQDTLRRAFQGQGLGARFGARSVRWYPAGSRSLAFASAVTAMLGDDRVAANVLAGSYGAELALILDASARRDIPSVAVSDQLEGQAVAFALAEEALIGEEIFAAGTYLHGGPVQVGESVAIDILRWLLIAALAAAFIAGLLGQGG